MSALNRWDIPFQRLSLGNKIAAGASGHVYKGTYVGCEVAIKELYATILSDRRLNEFSQEAARLAQLVHPNIVAFYGFAFDDVKQSYYLITEFCPKTLAYIRDDPRSKLSYLQKLRISQQIAEALAFLHAQSIVHRDVKPENVLLKDTLQVKLCDFGLAKMIKREKGKRVTLDVGSPRYMAPELIDLDCTRAARMSIDERMCDVYSFGCVLVTLWNGGRDIR